MEINWLDQLNNAMDYIETQLPGPIDPAAVARKAACSSFHLQRMFPYMTGMTLTDYIRRRRMSLAAMDLAAGQKVLDVALACGYDSPTAFNRAFKAVMGVAPSATRDPQTTLKQYPRLAFSVQIKGESAMEFKIVEVPAFRVVGWEAGGEWTMENSFEKAAEFWALLGKDDAAMIRAALALRDGSTPEGLLGVSFCDDGQFKGYVVGVATDAPAPEGMVERVSPAATYAVFEVVGALPEAMWDVQKRIVSEWLPASGYQWASKSDVEVYFSEDMRSADCRSQVWLPIEKRA